MTFSRLYAIKLLLHPFINLDRLSHPYISNHPTQTFTSETGDIIINNTKPQPKNKKVWIIGGIAAVGAAIIVIAFVALFLSKPTDGNKIKSSGNELYNYGNYLFNGSDSDQAITDPPSYYSTYFYNNLSSSDCPLKVLTKAKEKFGRFQEKYQQYRTNIDDVSVQTILDESVKLNSIQISNLEQYLEITNLNESDMLSMYISNGGTYMEQSVGETYKGLVSSNSALLNSIGEAKIAIAGALNYIYNGYDARGCIKDNELDNSCIERNTWPTDLEEQQSKVTTLQNDIIYNYRQLIVNVLNACWNTINIFNGLEIK